MQPQPQPLPTAPTAPGPGAAPLVSVIVLNYNAAIWIERCLESLRAQTIYDRIEIIFADNQSTDGSDAQAERAVAGRANERFLQNGCNPGFGGGVNLAARFATGEFLFLLNPDVWLEADCIEKAVAAARRTRAGIVGILVMDYENDQVQTRGWTGLDVTGNAVMPPPGIVPRELYAACGFTFISRELFQRIGQFDEKYFLYCEETDLSWRVWIAGETVIHAPEARMHHRGAAAENPRGGTRLVELRTSESKRFYANRNQLLTLLKHAEHVLLLLLVPAVAVLLAESLVWLCLVRRWSFFRRSFVDPLKSCWQLRHHIRLERQRERAFRRRGDFFMMRFLTWRLNRWQDFQKVRKLGLPKVDAR